MRSGSVPARALAPTRLEWLWFAGAFLFGLVMLVLLPPFQTNDETVHWMKLYGVIEHQPQCEPLPQRVLELISATRYDDTRAARYLWRLGSFDDAFAAVRRTPASAPGAGAACSYPAIGYVVPGVLARTAERLWPSEKGAILVAYYAARLGNWLELTAGVLLVLLTVPLARSWTLLAYSIPMVVHQGVSINQDAAIMALHCVLVVVLFRLRGWPQLGGVVVVVAMLAAIKPIYAPLMLWALPSLWELTFRGHDRGVQRWRLIGLGSCGLLVAAAALWRLWPWITLPRHVALGTPSWTDPGHQVWNIFHRPALLWAALRSQLGDNLRRGSLTGGWTSVLGVMGWCQFGLPEPAYRQLLRACVLALLAAVAARPGTPTLPATRSWVQALVVRGLPALAPLLVVLLVDVAFWVMFTEPGRPAIIGVQGRYYHGALYVAGIGLSSWLARRSWLGWARQELLHAGATAAAMACIVSAWSDTAQLVYRHYWLPVF
jgi:hypothetical protein